MIGDSLGQKDTKALVQTNRSLCYLLTPNLNRFALMPQHRTTAFYWAAMTGNEALVRLLACDGINFRVQYTTQDANLSRTTIELEIPLKYEVDRKVEFFLEKGSELIILDNYEDSTPLHRAAKHRHNNMFRSLLEMGADMEVNDVRKWTVLHQAVYENNSFAVKLLLEKGANANCQDNEGNTPLHFAAHTRNKTTARLLLGAKADVAPKDVRGRSAVDLANEWGDEDLMTLLLRSAARDFTFGDKQTGLHFAANHGDTETAIILLNKGVDIEARNSTGGTALHEAAGCGHFELVTLLLEKGANVDARNNEGSTPLHLQFMSYRVQENRQKITNALLEKGASVTCKNKFGVAVIDCLTNTGFARNCRDDEGRTRLFEQLLAKAGANFRAIRSKSTTLHLAAEYASEAFVRELLDNGADIAESNKDGWNALHFAAKWPSDEAKIQLLLTKGANVTSRTNNGQTAVDIALNYGIVRASMLEKVDVNFRTVGSKITALHLAAKIGNERLTKLFINKGLDINVRDNQGKTALHYAARTRETAVVKLLLKNGADNTIQDVNNSIPLFDALRCGHTSGELTRLLVKGIDIDPTKFKGYYELQYLAGLLGNEEAWEVMAPQLGTRDDVIPTPIPTQDLEDTCT